MRWWLEPSAGEIVWCHFPDNLNLKAKARPALVCQVIIDNHKRCFVTVAYGTSKKLDRLYKNEFLLSRESCLESFYLAGLSYDTKFDLGNRVELPFNSDYFSVPPRAPFGENPKMGLLNPRLIEFLETKI